MTEKVERPIPALRPRGTGHQFLLYGDACSGVAGALHEQTFASVNAVAARLEPRPEFVIFTGDEVIGLTADRAELEAQWQHWLQQEMAWLDTELTPLWHCTGNHTTYNSMSEEVFREVLNLPRNGPPGQEGLSYWVRRDDLLVIFVHTLWSGLGGEGYVETEWLAQTLAQHQDAAHKLVVGHHPVFAVNGYAGDYQRTVAPECGARLWDVLIEYGVTAYLCSHILAYDVQVHKGVLQICTAGAGTAHRMPEGDEYLHAVQVALDQKGIRWQVLDVDGGIRETLDWPSDGWTFDEPRNLPAGPSSTWFSSAADLPVTKLAFTGATTSDRRGVAQTLLALGSAGALASLWIGLRGVEQQLTAVIGNAPGRSPHYWFGPKLSAGQSFQIEMVLHPEMGAGGLLYRVKPDTAWTSLTAASTWGLERMPEASQCYVGHGGAGAADAPFRGENLAVRWSQVAPAN